jgi:hypothetical protein
MTSRNRNRRNCFLSPWQTISDRAATENWEAYVARNVETKHHDQCIQWGIHGFNALSANAAGVGVGSWNLLTHRVSPLISLLPIFPVTQAQLNLHFLFSKRKEKHGWKCNRRLGLEVIRYIYLQLMYTFILFDHLFYLIQRDSVYNVDKYEEAKKSNQIQRIRC